MRTSFSHSVRAGLVLLSAMFCASLCFAQFSGSIQGIVEDPSNAGVAKARVDLVNAGTNATRTTTTDDAGNYTFPSVAPGSYKISVEASGFRKAEANVTLLTEQNLNVPISLKVGSTSEAITVTTEAPLVDTADSRTQLTLESQAVAQLPIAGRNLVTLVTLAPGVSGLGTGALAGTPPQKKQLTPAPTARARITINMSLMALMSPAEFARAY
jgi:hypothetical protein